MLKEWDITIPELTGGRARRAYVYLPKNYEKTDKRYPVLYMLDGQNLFSDKEATFGKSWRIGEYIDSTNTEVIIAAVECDTQGNGRLSEYSPVDFAMDGGFIEGRGGAFMYWLTHDFKRYIDGNFRTLKDRANTGIAGSSMGGLMALYGACSFGATFSGAAALSPSLWVAGDNAPDFLYRVRGLASSKIYLSYGSREFANHYNQRRVFGQAVQLLIEKSALVTACVIPGGTHSELSWRKEVPAFMQFLFKK